MKFSAVLLSILFSGASLSAAETVIIAKQFHIDDKPNFSREPYGLLWRAQDKAAHDRKFGGAVRLTLHLAQTDLTPSLVPVLDDNSLDFDRLRVWRSKKVERALQFAEESNVSLHEDRSLWATPRGTAVSVQIGLLKESNMALLCTGGFRAVCGLKLEGRSVAVTAPVDWDAVSIAETQVPVVECLPQDVVLKNAPGTGSSKTVSIDVVLEAGHGTSCEEISKELDAAAKLYAVIGLHLEFSKAASPFGIRASFVDKLKENKSDEHTSVSGRADRANRSLALGQPTNGRRHSLVLAHEIGHVLGLEHVSAEDNLMMSGGITDANTELTPTQIKILLSK